METNPFDTASAAYDAWFEAPRGRAIFASEVACLRPLASPHYRPWLEVGVGTGRFAAALEFEAGVDPSRAMLASAARRGLRVRLGRAEALPYPDRSFGGLLFAVTLCFVSDPAAALREAHRVLRGEGRLAIGMIPAGSPWGRQYAREGEAGHPIYRHARFYGVAEVAAMAAAAGFQRSGPAFSTLLQPPEAQVVSPEPPQAGVVPEAGFVALSFATARA